MARIVERVQLNKAKCPDVIRVAAYARVSSAKDAMYHSLSAQVSYYSSLIQKTPGWLYCGVYADEAMTGTKEDRANFQKLLTECRNGNIDMVITKSISRFARNTVTLLETVRELKELGIDVYFEEQNIHSKSASGELMLTVLASFAQAESLSASENQKWRIKKNFEEGKPWNCTMLGYRFDGKQFIVIPDEAEIVKTVFADYLSGMGLVAIAKKLNENGVPTRKGNPWCKQGVKRMLENCTYTGNLLLQKTYRENHLTKAIKYNNGERTKYYAQETHEPIISLEDFATVQVEIARRGKEKKDKAVASTSSNYPFTGLLFCENCGKTYRRKTTAKGAVWICSTYNQFGKDACPSKRVPEERLFEMAVSVVGKTDFDAEYLKSQIEKIIICDGNTVKFFKTDGSTKKCKWKDRSRSESWTAEMREAARNRAKGAKKCPQ